MMQGEQARASPPKFMTVSFHHFLPDQPVSAFHDGRIRMSFGSPIVECLIAVPELQSFIMTLEQAIDDEPSHAQQQALRHILCTLKATYQMHLQQHEELMKDAPVGADFEEYMMSYTKAIQQGEI